MTDKLDFVKIETKGFYDLCNRLKELEEENQSLRLDNYFLQRQNTALKMRCSKYSLEIKELSDELDDLKFTHNYLTSEDAGKAFAESLIGGK